MTVQEPPDGGTSVPASPPTGIDDVAPIAEPPRAGKLAGTGRLVAGAVSSLPVPGVGGVLAEAFEMMLDRGLNRRRDAWEGTVVAAINRLIEWNKALADSEVLMTAIVKAGRIALATHQQEKLDSLRNAVVNSVAPNAPSDDEQARFFRLIDELTPAHLIVMRFLDSPGDVLRSLPADRRPSPVVSSAELVRASDLFAEVAPDINTDAEWRNLLMYDLSSAQLTITMGSLEDNYTQLDDSRRFVTGLGQRFLQFIGDEDWPTAD